MTTTQSRRIQPGYEPIKGYVLEQLLGRGGYGEVWQAEAPGGLKKAVKFVFGRHDERCAEQELKSLERIKGIQHPFILTLERFELIENQLVIVTELAEGSLDDVLKQHQKRGASGIPRDALLGYMKDTADALDYLHQLYKLQHLDIKPANLLIVGGRVKVADFGLIKDLGEVECSLVGGLTPIYAPPEVFDGRPSMYSDQYSLAVMYQELLTGTRPFTGRTIAQLATQHVHNAPNLNPLPSYDRPSVARALEKTPQRRYESCSEFVNKLLHSHGQPAVHAAQPEAKSSQPESAPVENLPRLTGAAGMPSPTHPTHTLVVGLGGTGANCLHQLRERIQEPGAVSPMILHSVLIDTDLMTTRSAETVAPTDLAPRCRTVHTHIRTPQEYRDNGTQRLRSISRRWIYNVPRNSVTGGMRPLGRLALVDHGRQVMETLRAAVNEIKSALPEGAAPKIYVVGSLTGGSGSGMYMDVVYLLRHLLDESAMENDAIVSLLTTNRFQGDPARPLALHSTTSAVRELAYFLKPENGYPGDPGPGWPRVPAARTPLHNTYLIAQSRSVGAPDPIDSVLNYLWQDASVCGKWFQNGRQQTAPTTTQSATLRSLNVIQIGDPRQRQSNQLAPHLIKTLLLRWLGNPRKSDASATEFCNRMRRRCKLDVSAMQQQIRLWFGKTSSQLNARILEQLQPLDPTVLADHRAVTSHLLKWLTEQIDSKQTQSAAEQIANQIDREVTLRLQDSRLDLSSTLVGLEKLRAHIGTLHCKLVDHSDVDPFTLSQDDLPGCDQTTDPMLVDACRRGNHLVQIVACRIAASVAQSLLGSLVERSKIYSNASKTIALGIRRLTEDIGHSDDPWKSMNKSTSNLSTSIEDQLHDQMVMTWLYRAVHTPSSVDTDSLISQLTSTAAELIYQRLENRDETRAFGSASGADRDVRGTSVILPSGGGHPDSDRAEAANSGKTTYQESHAETIGMTQTHCWPVASSVPALTLPAALAAARPSLLECGGQQRLYLICRDKQQQLELEAQLPADNELSITTILARCSMPMLVHEAQGIELQKVIDWLDSLTGDDGKISARLATRCDIDWI
ncbi:protein kinase [Stieleria sp. TO1_6]|uniref:protein kinase domain-containing protein n=1 Tax=Stieleria tagensis TaxID=2956795 RepID=UPI00209B9EFD|nr:tubulin-like doman-containing protein [Stieleria tagensis]MCO8123695.1 protein kinase [Stieleria tagensis]